MAHFNSSDGLPGVVDSLAGEPATALRSHKRTPKTAAKAQDMKKIGDVSQAARNNFKRLIMDNLNI